jgi:hypothetical protein
VRRCPATYGVGAFSDAPFHSARNASLTPMPRQIGQSGTDRAAATLMCGPGLIWDRDARRRVVGSELSGWRIIWGAGMIDVASSNPHKEEDEGYLAAEAGQRPSDNPYPRGTLRHDHWRRGWRIKTDEISRALRLGRAEGR